MTTTAKVSLPPETPVDTLDALGSEAAYEHLLACCGARRWAEQMVAARPFGIFGKLASTATAIWERMERDDVLEAFAAHPDLGDRELGKAADRSRSAGWSRQEQSLTGRSDDQTLEALAEGNREYAERFGYRFILCATGREGREMLAELERRLENAPATELAEAAAEQLAITQLRLAKLVTELEDHEGDEESVA